MLGLICFKSFCEKKAEYQCNCSFPQTLWCSSHLANHLVSSNNEHPIEAITKKENASAKEISSPLVSYPAEHDFRSSFEDHYDYQNKYSYEHPNENPYELPYKNPPNSHSDGHPYEPSNEYSHEHSFKPHFEASFEDPSETLNNIPVELLNTYSHEVVHQEPNPTIESTLVLINEQISAIEKIKNKFTKKDLESSYCSIVLQNSLHLIELYNEALDEIKIDTKRALCVTDFFLPLIDIMNMIDNIKFEIEILEKIDEIIFLENQVKSCWLANILESPEKINELKSYFIEWVEGIEKWCFQYINTKTPLTTIDREKVSSLTNALNLILELINQNFEVKYFFRIEANQLLIYGTEARKWSNIPLPFEQYNICSINAQVVELPNYKIFCVENRNYPFIFDLKTWKISKIFPEFYVHDHSVPIYYENCVYVFSMRNLPCLEKFNLISSKKTRLPSPFINYLSTLSCCLYKNSILICSERSWKLCKFDLIIECYSEIQFIELNPKNFKMLFTGNMRAYIADSKNWIFESEADNEYSWNKIGLFQTNSIGKCINRSYLNLAYFSIMENKSMEIYQFDLCRKKIYYAESSYNI